MCKIGRQVYKLHKGGMSACELYAENVNKKNSLMFSAVCTNSHCIVDVPVAWQFFLFVYDDEVFALIKRFVRYILYKSGWPSGLRRQI